MAKSTADAPAARPEEPRDGRWINELGIRELASILEETGLTEIEIERGDLRLRIQRQPAPVAAAVAPSAPAPVSVGSHAPAPEAPSAPAAQSASPGAPAGAVTSPMVGTVYLSPSPDAPAFCKPGDSVTEGQTLLIVEAMKTMNPVVAPRNGTVREILVRNEQAVEFGEPLLALD
ncbi:MAG: acetyl-CoA carboxylase biotin carboxyl carrier protein [Parvularculaceae bacterium]